MIKNFKLKIKNSHSGFTLIELLVVLAIGAAIATVSFLSIGGQRASNDLQRTGETVVAALAAARQNSLTQQNGTRWGMRFSNASSGQTYTMFGGASYASSASKNAYTLTNGISFGNPPTSTSIDVLFNPVTGEPSQGQIVSLNDGRKDGLVYDVAVNGLGSVEGKFWQGLVGYWPFDEGTGTTAYDVSGYATNGAWNGGLVSDSHYTQGKVGMAGNFNGADDYVLVTSNLQNILGTNPSAWSYSAWFKTNGTITVKKEIFSNYDSSGGDNLVGVWTGINANGNTGQIFVDVRGTGAPDYLYTPAGTRYDDSRWHFVAVSVQEGNSLRGYIDNIQFASSSLGTTNYIDNAPLRIGALKYNGALQEFWSGSLDEVRLYNRALSAQEIQDLYNETQ